MENYTERIGKPPAESLLGALLTGMLDPQTKREFINLGGLIGDYDAMRSKVAEIAGSMATATPMDTSLICQPCDEPLFAAENDVRKPNHANPNHADKICWNCQKKGTLGV